MPIINGQEMFSIEEMAEAFGIPEEEIISMIQECPHLYQDKTIGVFDDSELVEFNKKLDAWLCNKNNTVKLDTLSNFLFHIDSVPVEMIGSMIGVSDEYIETIIENECEFYDHFLEDGRLSCGAVNHLIQRIDPVEAKDPCLILALQMVASEMMMNVLQNLPKEKKAEMNAMLHKLFNFKD